jgi:hypothetical protein
MRGAGRMNGQRARIANIGNVVEQFKIIDELLPASTPSLKLKAHQSTIAAAHHRIGALARASPSISDWVDDLGDAFLLLTAKNAATLSAFSQCARILSGRVSMPCRNMKRIKRRHGPAHIAQQGGAGFHNIGNRAERFRLAPYRAMIRRVGRVECRLAIPRRLPNRNYRHRQSDRQ